MKYLFNLLAVLSVAFLIGCAGTLPGKGYVNVLPDEIVRLIEKEHDNDLYAVGTANNFDEGMAIRQAALQARTEISRQFKTKISALQKDYSESVNGQNIGEFKNAIDELTTLELKGSKVIKSMARVEKNGSYSVKVLVVVSSEWLKDAIEEKMRDYTDFRASEAYKELFERLKLEE